MRPLPTIPASLDAETNVHYEKDVILGSLLICVVFFIFPSPILSTALPKFHLYFTPFFFLAVSAYLLKNKISLRAIILAAFILAIGAIASLVARSTSQLGISFLLVAYILFGTIIQKIIGSQAFLRHVNLWMATILIFAWVSLAYFYLGGDALLTIQNPDGRPNHLFLASFTNSNDYAFWGIIRPSGLYDEPGALSFVTTLVVIINEYHKPRTKAALLLMLAGMVTLSVTHAILLSIYFIYYAIESLSRLQLYALLAAIASTILITASTIELDKESALYRNFLIRLTFNSDGKLSGDNRSTQIDSFASDFMHRKDIALKGHQTLANENNGSIYWEDQSSNPFSIWFNYGIIMWSFYFLTLTHIAHKAFGCKDKYLSALFLVLLLLQRPLIFDSMWGPALWATIILFSSRPMNSPARFCGVVPSLSSS